MDGREGPRWAQISPAASRRNGLEVTSMQQKALSRSLRAASEAARAPSIELFATRVSKFCSRAEQIWTRTEKLGTRIEQIGTRVKKFRTRVKKICSRMSKFRTRMKQICSRISKFRTRESLFGSIESPDGLTGSRSAACETGSEAAAAHSRGWGRPRHPSVRGPPARTALDPLAKARLQQSQRTQGSESGRRRPDPAPPPAQARASSTRLASCANPSAS